MHITRIELENIKSYESAAFEFGRGTTAIMGENGAGKTSLIEAVAWTLFDLLDYKKDDFLKRGTKRGLVRVEFESGLDERRYIVQRDTRTAYFVYDPRLKTRIADKKEEVTRFLWQHLGVEPGTDLESLFRRAIGVPQGTFTAIFLETPNERKKAFDKLLKVEEYRIGAMRLGRTAKHIDAETLEIIQRISRAEGELGNREKLKKDLKSFSGMEKEFLASLKKFEKEVAKQNKSVSRLEKTKTEYESFKTDYEKFRQEQERTGIVSTQAKKEVAAAEKAADVVKATSDAHARHKKAIGMLSELERERKEREKLRTALTDIEKAILSVQAEQKSVKAKLDEIESKRKAVAELEPLVETQDRLEADKKKLEESVSKNREKSERVKSLEIRLKELRERHKSNKSEIAKVEGLKAQADEAEALRKRDEQITNELASLRARIERDREFQVQIEGGLCPVFSEKCLNLKPGQTLEGFLSDKFSGLKAKVRALEEERKTVAKSSEQAREAHAVMSRLPMLLQRREEIEKDGTALREEQDKLSSDVEMLSDELAKLKKVESELAKLGDPKGRIAILKKDLGQVRTLREQSTKIESNFERLESDRRLKVEQLETYKDLDSNWKEYSEQRDATAVDNTKYLKHESLAASLDEKKAKLAEAESKLEKIANSLKSAKSSLDAAAMKFDADAYSAELESLRANELELARIEAETRNSSARKKEIEAELERLKKTEQKLAGDQKEKERLDRLSQTVTFIRNTLKAAAPRVAKNYVFHVSVEANTLYREITGNAEVTLRWTDDYGIELEEDGFDRPFLSLSGGEQMSAALAVRLALLRQLSDIRLAFFDEPTTNMDLERRERLAEQISRITENQTFDQLFVISHDDTFESFADHVIEIG